QPGLLDLSIRVKFQVQVQLLEGVETQRHPARLQPRAQDVPAGRPEAESEFLAEPFIEQAVLPVGKLRPRHDGSPLAGSCRAATRLAAVCRTRASWSRSATCSSAVSVAGSRSRPSAPTATSRTSRSGSCNALS